jgi:quinolinate synthase
MIQTDILPDEYRSLDAAALRRRIRAAKERLGKDLCILGHYYQRDEVVEWADFEGDSFELSRKAAATDARFIVFCGVRFMAEAAAILAAPTQRVFLPAMDAGCPLADMADIEQAEVAWRMLADAAGEKAYLPIAYMNSSAAVKAFCGRHGGTICTSSSAGKAFQWAMGEGKKILFLPDENLGRNTAADVGFEPGELALWDPASQNLRAQAQAVKAAEVLLWKGHCHVHTFFQPEHVERARAQYSGCVVAVHPECSPEVVAASDANGSTSFLKRYAGEAAPGSTVVIGTEINLVGRLARQNPGKRIVPLARSLCPNMFRTSAADLCWVLERIGEVNEVAVPAEVANNARVALERMLGL